MAFRTVRAAADRLGVSYATFKRWIRLASPTQTAGGHHRLSDAEVERLLARRPPASGGRMPAAKTAGATAVISGRNRLRGFVDGEIRTEGLMAQVRLRVGDQWLTAVITRDAVEELKLRRGDEAVAIVKSTEVMIAREATPRSPASAPTGALGPPVRARPRPAALERQNHRSIEPLRVPDGWRAEHERGILVPDRDVAVVERGRPSAARWNTGCRPLTAMRCVEGRQAEGRRVLGREHRQTPAPGLDVRNQRVKVAKRVVDDIARVEEHARRPLDRRRQAVQADGLRPSAQAKSPSSPIVRLTLAVPAASMT